MLLICIVEGNKRHKLLLKVILVNLTCICYLRWERTTGASTLIRFQSVTSAFLYMNEDVDLKIFEG